MLSPAALAQILERPDVWRGNALAGAPLPGITTGFAALDAELPGGGWPRGGLIELMPARTGVGELALLLPVLAADGVGAVVAWLPEANGAALRRLQLAAETSRTLLFVFRPANCAAQPSPAPLRLLLEGEGERLIVRLLKRCGGARLAPLPINIRRPFRSPGLRNALICPASAARSFSSPAIA